MGSKEKKKQKMTENHSSQKRKGKESGNAKPQIITDDRFASAQSDPRFMDVMKTRSKVSIDSRFHRIFTDKRFTSNARVDKRGKRNKNKKAASSLEHYYSLKKEDDVDDKKEEEEGLGDRKAQNDESDSDTDIEDEKLEALDGDESDDVDEQDIDESSSTTSTDSEDQFSDEVEEEDTFLQPEDNVPDIDKETKRLAVVNLDWSQVRAVDLYVLLSSFLPKDGQIHSVSVYPSDFGVQRMEEEAVRGPVGLFDDEESDDEENDELDSKKLRTYELSRLRYYYAVVECDSSATADHLYKTCDGVEFERSANKLDLRFIPDSMDFKHQARDVATEAAPNYEGLYFQTRALQHSNIQLTWDEDEPQRAKTLNRKLTEEQLAELELKEILASDESESDDDKKMDAYRSLIQGGDVSDEEDNDNDNDQDMEVTFNSGLEDISKRILEKKSKKSETVWEAYLRKRKEKRKASKNMSKDSSDDDSDTDQESGEDADDFFVEPSALGSKTKTNPVQKTKHSISQETTGEAEATRAELELLVADDNDPVTNLKGYSLKPKKNKGKKGAISDVGKMATADYNDPRFSALFNSPLFALDPTDPQFKRSATYARQIAEKNKMAEENARQKDTTETRRQALVVPEDEKMKISNERPANDRIEKKELASLVRSIKMKSKQVSLPSQIKSHKRKR